MRQRGLIGLVWLTNPSDSFAATRPDRPRLAIQLQIWVMVRPGHSRNLEPSREGAQIYAGKFIRRRAGCSGIVPGSFDPGEAPIGSRRRSTAGPAEVASLNQALKTAAAAPAPAARPSAPGRPDPGKVYDIKIGDGPIRGSKSAKITVVEWADFQCPFCVRVNPTLEKVAKEYGDKVRFSFKHLPLSMHSKARAAHQAAEAAHRQGKFWEMHDRIFAKPKDLSEETYLRYANEIGLRHRSIQEAISRLRRSGRRSMPIWRRRVNWAYLEHRASSSTAGFYPVHSPMGPLRA